MSNALLWVISLLTTFLRTAKDHEDCPDGVCDQPLALAGELTATLRQPTVGLGIFDMWRLLRCVPMQRVTAVLKRLGSLIAGCDSCPDGDCNFFDLLGCIDLKELVAIVQEVLSIIRDSAICDDDDDEITLGQAAA